MIVSFLIGFALTYFVISFIGWEFNPKYWDVSKRIGLIWIGFLVTAFSLMCIYPDGPTTVKLFF